MTNPLAGIITAVRDYLGSWGTGDKALASLFGRGPTVSGINMTSTTAMNISAVWACVQLIAGNVGSLPLMHYRRKGNSDREKATDTKLYRLLHDEPNTEMAAPTFFETLQKHVLLEGNAFAEISRDAAGRVASLYPIEPWRVSAVRQNGLAGELLYRIAQRDGRDAILTASEILHVPGLSDNGVWGISVIRHARESFGLTAATEQFGASFFGKGSTFGGILSHPGSMTPQNIDQLRSSLEARHQGVERAHQFIILQGGMKFEPLGIPGRDAQFLQQRQFQLSEIARWFAVPPHMIGDVEKSTSWGTGITQQTIGFLQFCLRRWLVKWEKELNRKLISPLERNLQFIEFVVDGLERGDQDSRYAAYAIGRQWGWLSVNDVRAYENLPKIEGGDLYLVPVNMTTPEKIEAAPPPGSVPPPEQPKPEPDDGEDAREEDDTAERMREFRRDLDEIIEIGKQALAKPDPAPTDLAPILDQLATLRKELVLTVDERSQHETAAIIEGLQAAQAALEARLAALPPPTEPVDLTPLVEKVDAQALSHAAQVDEHAAQIDAMWTKRAAADEYLLSKLESAEASRLEQAARIASLTPILRDVIEDAVRRVVRVEADRARRAAASPEKLRAWMETFYLTREDAVVQQLMPSMRLHFQLIGRLDEAAAATRLIAHAHVEESRLALETLLGDAATLEANVKALTAHWEAERPKAVADACVTEVIAGV